jgi:hypothetical protein
MSEREASTPQKKECEHLIMYLFIYPRWRTFGGRQQCALSLSLSWLNNATRTPIQREDERAGYTHSLTI